MIIERFQYLNTLIRVKEVYKSIAMQSRITPTSINGYYLLLSLLDKGVVGSKVSSNSTILSDKSSQSTVTVVAQFEQGLLSLEFG